MKITVKAMEDKIQSLMNELKEQNQTNKEVEIIENVLSHKNKDRHTSDEETGPKTVNHKRETLLKCDICKQQFKTEKTLSKHINTKREGYTSCDTCGTKFSSSETLAIHTADTHKSKENVKCSNWICMEETGSCGGFCVYD